MKKYFIAIAVLVLSISFVSESKADFSAGLRIGFNASKFTGKDSIGRAYNFAPGLHIGPYFRVGIKEKYRIQAEVLFSTKGSSEKKSYGTSLENYYTLPFYIDVPVMFNYKPVAGLYIEAGVQPSFALTALNFSANTTSYLDKSGIKTLDFAPIVGLGYEFSKLSLGLRGSFGVTNINEAGGFYTPDNKNMTLMATFGFKF